MITIGICRINEERILPFAYSNARDAINFFMPFTCDAAITMAIERNDIDLYHEAINLGLPKDDVKVYGDAIICNDVYVIGDSIERNYDSVFFVKLSEWLDEMFFKAVAEHQERSEANENEISE